MPHKGPHISIAPDFVVHRILRIDLTDFRAWPQAVRALAIEIAEELFLVVYNPFVDPVAVKASVKARFDREVFALAHHFATSISEGITLFWSGFEAEAAARVQIAQRLKEWLPEDAIITSPGALVACSTDATDLRMELPLLVVEPSNDEEIRRLICLANEMKFALIPSGGASGMTGGAVPVRKRSVIVRLTRLTQVQPVDTETMTVTLQAGVITQAAVESVAKDGYLLTIDPASRSASTIGGNVAENSGGPCAFEYGTTLDNLLSWKMVTPTGEIIEIVRVNHPRHKILSNEVATFEVRDLSGGVRNVVELKGDDIRLPGLGKDVTDKALGGLPGMQKEGVDGIITEATFVVHPRPALSRVMVLEFYGSSMHEAAVVIGEIVALRDKIRQEGDYARLSALEEFNAKYVQALGYERKSLRHEGLPISVIILQVDGDEAPLLDRCVAEIVAIVGQRDTVALMVAADEREAEHFWEDRHRLSAIAKRTSGFKINEDVVIPMHKIPDFAIFLENLNRRCAGVAYLRALQEVTRLRGVSPEHEGIADELAFATQHAGRNVLPDGVAQEDGNCALPVSEEETDDDIEAHAVAFLQKLKEDFPDQAESLQRICDDMCASRVIVASHMHAGDGNCHVNIPVNSNDLEMLELAEDVAMEVMEVAQRMNGAVSGEHGIGITKLAFLGQEKMEAIRLFKARVDPRDVFNPAKLTQKDLPVRPFTFSFNRLINDLRESGLPDTEGLIRLLSLVQICTRCGKCKEVCPMLYPERSIHYHPRNKNMVLGAIVEAVYYSQVTTGRISAYLLEALRELSEHCTGCGRCETVCPVKIPSAEVALQLRAFLVGEGAGGHPVKERALSWIAQKPTVRIPQMAKAAAFGQQLQNRLLDVLPFLTRRMANPLFSGKGPNLGYRNLYEALHPERGNCFVPDHNGNPVTEAVLYFPGCGGSLFSRGIGLSSLALLLESGVGVVLPSQHVCCGYPLIASGALNDFAVNRKASRDLLRKALEQARQAGLIVRQVVIACPTCREGLQSLDLPGLLTEVFGKDAQEGQSGIVDIMSYIVPRLDTAIAEIAPQNREIGAKAVYHVSCHAEEAALMKIGNSKAYYKRLGEKLGVQITPHTGCCGESGMGAISSPHIYNELRQRKAQRLAVDLKGVSLTFPVLVSCPSCKVGLTRIMLQQQKQRPVLHVSEWLARQLFGARWGKKWLRVFRSRVARKSENNIRVIPMQAPRDVAAKD